MDTSQETVTFISREEWERRLAERQALLPKPSPSMLANAIPEYTRKDVIDDFRWAFLAAGGREALAIWAMNNQTEYYRLYARLLPSGSSEALGEENKLLIEHVLPRSKLDGD